MLVPKKTDYSEWVSKQARLELVRLLHRKVEEDTKDSKGRPNINRLVGEHLGISEIGVVKVMREDYACSDATARMAVKALYTLDKRGAKQIIRADLKAHQTRLAQALKNLENGNGNS